MNKAAFFDRDGVLNDLVMRNGGFYSPQKFDDFKIKSNINNVISRLKQTGFLIIVISNQPDISRGKMFINDLKKMTLKLKKELNLDDVLYCLHDDYDHCICRKPKPGLILQAKKKWNINLEQSFLVGDTWRDMEAAKNANVKYFLIDTNYNKKDNYNNRLKDVKEIFSIING